MQRGLSRGSQFTEQLGCGGLLLRAARCAEKKEDAGGTKERCERKERRRPREETRRRTEEGKSTNAVGGSWRRNDYRPRTHSLPAIISSTNATKSIRRLSEIWPGRIGCTRSLFHIYNDYARSFKFKCRMFKLVLPVDKSFGLHTY